MYGLMLLLAIAACIALTGWRWVRWGGDWDLVFRVAVWGVVFGRPTRLRWKLHIDDAHVPAGYFGHNYFHPTFLYEFVYDCVGVGILLAVDRYFRIKRPALFALYVSYYCFGRFFEELLRIDPA